MERVTSAFTIRYSIHANAWTETLAGLLYLIDQIDHVENKGDSVNQTYLTRLTIISSSYLAEQVFVQASKQYVDELLAGNPKDAASHLLKRLLKGWNDRNSIQKVGISRAMEEWPKVLKGRPLKLGEEPLQSLKLVMEKRNNIIHKLSDLTRYGQASDVARSALHTAVEGSKNIWDHFFPETAFPYDDWLSEYPIPSACYFGKLKI